MERIDRRPAKHPLLVLMALGILCTSLALGGCTTTSTAIAHEAPTPSASNGAQVESTPSPEPSPTAVAVAAFSCAAGSLPVTSTAIQTSCTAQSANGVATVQATYTSTGAGSFVDENLLIAAGWVIAGLTNADGLGFSGTWYLYLNQGSWITWGPTENGAMGVWASVPVKGAPIRCGKAITGDALPHMKIPLPHGTQTVTVFQIAPFCVQDVVSFYTTALAAARWTADEPFQLANASDSGAATASATFTRNGESVHLFLIGAAGTPTEITIS